MRARAVLVGVVVLVGAACGSDDSPVVAGDPGGDDPGVYEANATVLDREPDGPVLCLGGVAESYPPQCGGVPIVGWDWDAVDDEESASGTTWGDYHVVGTFDGTTFTLTETPGPARWSDDDFDLERFAAPCDEPPGGWPVVSGPDAELGRQALAETAREEPDYAGLWVDHRGARSFDDGSSDAAADPELMIYVVAFTGDLERHEAELRAVYDGPLCVTQHERTYDDLLRIQEEAMEAVADLGLEVLHAGVDDVANRVDVGVVAVRADAQDALDERFGAGAVRLVGALRPVTAD